MHRDREIGRVSFLFCTPSFFHLLLWPLSRFLTTLQQILFAWLAASYAYHSIISSKCHVDAFNYFIKCRVIINKDILIKSTPPTNVCPMMHVCVQKYQKKKKKTSCFTFCSSFTLKTIIFKFFPVKFIIFYHFLVQYSYYCSFNQYYNDTF
jgi:hypothetical protein